MLLRETYPHQHSRARKGWEPLLCPGEETPLSLLQGGNVAGCRPFTTTIWVTLGMENGVALSSPLCSSLGRGAQGLLQLLSPALSVLECSSLCSCPIIAQDSAWWHMLVGEERTEG